MTIKIEGIIPAMVTPMRADEDLNLEVLSKLTDHLIAAGVHGLFATGSQGEAYALTRDERQRVWETAVAATRGRVPVYAGTGAITTREAVILTKLAERVGVDAVSLITPYFIYPSQDELIRHYLTVADATSLPVLLYNNPGRTGGVSLAPETVVHLAKHPNIVGVKDSSGDLSLTLEYIRRTDEDFAVLMGRDTLILAGLMMGARGAIAATANVAPELVVRIYEAWRCGDWTEARLAQAQLAPLRQAFGLGTFPGVVKEAMTMLGLPVGPARAPVAPLSPERRQQLRQVVHNITLTQASASKATIQTGGSVLTE
ncbi:MAG TPA: 4-hydroxy-tetrahydrodipicolinate synthase [Chloroflexi bacterium]|nr:4-hydroxy-tetrahydrodipicolinate synthase [Chloroflexota bacterium]